MAQKVIKREGSASSSPNLEPLQENKKYTAAELKEWYSKQSKRIENFEEANTAAKMLRDLTRTTSKSVPTFQKERLREYIQNISSNENNIRNLSWYLYYRSMIYMRLCNLYPNILELNVKSIIPEYDMEKGADAKKMLKALSDTSKLWELWHLPKEYRDIALTCMVQDVFYGIWIEDDTGLFIWQVPAQYAQLCGKYMTGDFAFAIDMSYFRSRQELLEYMPDPLQSMWNEYESTRNKWIIVPDEYSICVKFRCEDMDTIIPPFFAMFNSIINLADLEDAQATADAIAIYKMVYLSMETLKNADMPDQWSVDPSIVVEYFNKMAEEALPDYISGAVVPGELKTVSFDDQVSNDTNKVTKATESLLNMAGSAELLNGATISGAEAFRTAQIITSNYVLKPLLPQFEAITNRHLSYSLGNPGYIKFYEVSSLTLNSFRENVLTLSQNGFPAKLLMGASIGLSERQTLALNALEEEVLGITEKYVPLNTSYTRTGDEEGGRPKDKEQTSDGEASAEKRDKSKG